MSYTLSRIKRLIKAVAISDSGVAEEAMNEKRNGGSIGVELHDVGGTKSCGTLIIGRTIIPTISKISFAFVRGTIVVIMLTVIAVVSKILFTTF